MPREVVILGKTFKVEYTTDMDKDDYGEMKGIENIIRINANRSDKTWEASLLHEIVHAVLYVTGHSERLDDNEEEALAVALENGLNDVVILKQQGSLNDA